MSNSPYWRGTFINTGFLFLIASVTVILFVMLGTPSAHAATAEPNSESSTNSDTSTTSTQPTATATSTPAPEPLRYDFRYQGQAVNGAPANSFTALPGTTATLQLDLENTGNAAWQNEGTTPVRLGTDRTRDHASPLANNTWDSPNRPGSFSETRSVGSTSTTSADTVAPGQVARFSFTITTPTVPGTYRAYFQPVIENFAWFRYNPGIFWTITVLPETYRYQWLTQTSTVPERPDQSGIITVVVKNDGNMTWTNTGDAATIRLGTSRANDRVSTLYDSSWDAFNRLGSFAGRAQLNADGSPKRLADGSLVIDRTITAIKPGEAAYFEFTVRTANRVYAAKEYFNLVVDGKSWLNDVGMHWPVQTNHGFAATWVDQSLYPTVVQSDDPVGALWFDFKNTGLVSWQLDGPLRLATSHTRDRASVFAAFNVAASNTSTTTATDWQAANRIGSFSGRVVDGAVDTTVTEIQPGQVGRFLVTLDTRNVAPGMYREYFNLVVEELAWLEDYGVHQDVRVLKNLSNPSISESSVLSPDWHRGASIPVWWSNGYDDPAAMQAVRTLAATGSTHVSFITTWYMDGRTGSHIYRDPARTPSDSGLLNIVALAKSLGMKVTLKPHVDPEPWSFRGAIAPSNKAQWFADYRAMINHYAELSERAGIDLLVIGTELNSMVPQTSEWYRVIAETRARYTGEITYAANWDAFEDVRFWDKLDYIAIDAYVPLNTGSANPTVEQLVAAWYETSHHNGIRHYVDEVSSVQAAYNKPVLFAEIGYQSRLGTANSPWGGSTGAVSDEPQRRAYEAAYRVWSSLPWFKGIYWWEWAAHEAGSADAEGHTIRGKAAEAVVRHWNTASNQSV